MARESGSPWRPCSQCGRSSFTSADACSQCRAEAAEGALVAAAEAVPALSVDEAARVRAAVDARHSANTLAAYRSAWTAWTAWADAHETAALPASPPAVAAFLAHRAESCRMATVRLAAAAIGAAHRAQNHDNPCAAEVVAAALRGLARQAAEAGTSAQRQAEALTTEALAAIRATACRQRRGPTGRTESAASAAKRGLADIAMAQVMADGGLRRSEAAALVWSDVRVEADGSGRLTVRRSKTDAEGEGAVVAITRQAVEDLERIRRGRPASAPVFGLSAGTIYLRMKAAARQAGLGDGFGGHSGRVGMARRMTARNAPLAVVMNQGRWASPRMVARYTRMESAGAALPFLE